jgi:hypothetical protein
MPQRRDYLLEFQCGTQRQVGHVTRSNRCYDNEIAQLKAKVERLEEAGDRMRLLCADGDDCDAWEKSKATP